MSFVDPTSYSGYTNDSPPPQDVNAFHKNSDVDTSAYAQHHSLGNKANQASPGNHKHSVIAAEWDPNIRNSGGTALAHNLLYCRYKLLEEICFFDLNFEILEAGDCVFDLPVASDYTNVTVAGAGRENQSYGWDLHVLKEASQRCRVFVYNNGNPTLPNVTLLLHGWYFVNVVPD